MNDQPGKTNWKKIYRFTFWLGLVYILLLGLFTYLFNLPL